MEESSTIGFEQWPSLAVSYCFFSQHNSPSLQINFCFDKSPYESGSEEAQKKAAADLKIYFNILSFLTSTENVSLSFCTSLDGTPENIQGTKRSIDLNLFVEQLLNPIVGFLKNIADPKNPTVLAPIPVPYAIETKISSIETYTDLFQLTVSLLIEAVAGENSTTFIFPQVSGLPCAKDETNSFHNFAEQFETVFSNQPKEGNSLKIANVILQNENTNSVFSFPILVMRFDEKGENGIRIVSGNSNPVYYSLLPLAQNYLTMEIPVSSYRTGQAFSNEVQTKVSFSEIDLNNWNKITLAAIDKFLSRAYTNAAALIDKRSIEEIIQAKQTIAAALAQNAAVISGTQNQSEAGLANAKAAWEKQLNIKLSNAYESQAMVQSPVAVNSCWTNPGNNIPSLTGTISGINSPANLILQNGTSYLTYFFNTASPTSFVDFNFTDLQFSINGILRNNGNENSSVLTFAVPPDSIAENKICVPIPCPFISPLPIFVSQRCTYPLEKSTFPSIQNARQWCYNFEYDITSIAAAQDTYKLQLNFNVRNSDENKNLQRAVNVSAAKGLAQFVHVYPALSADLDKYLLAVTPQNAKSNSTEITNARYAVQTFVSITKIVANSWAGFSETKKTVKENPNQPQLNYSIVESPEELTGDLLISIIGIESQILFPGKITIPGYTALAIDNAKNVYKYANPNGVFLSFAGRLQNSIRIFSPNDSVDILNTENVSAGMSIARNENLFGNTVNGRTITNQGFITSTRVVSQQNFIPFLSYDPSINIATILQTQTKPSLQTLMENLFAALMENVIAGIELTATVSYSYQLQGTDLPVNIPVLMNHLLIANTSDQEQAANEFTQSLQTWMQQTQPSTNAGQFLFAVNILSSINLKTPKLKLSLFLSLEDFG